MKFRFDRRIMIEVTFCGDVLVQVDVAVADLKVVIPSLSKRDNVKKH